MDPAEITTLKSILTDQPVAALATLHEGGPAVSMVPFALLGADAGFVIHVSRLASHTGDMLVQPAVALLVQGSLAAGESPLALPRVSVRGRAAPCLPDSAGYAAARAAYLAKLPEAEELFAFADFSLFVIVPAEVRFVAGFGRALTLTPERLRAVLAAS